MKIRKMENKYLPEYISKNLNFQKKKEFQNIIK